MKLVSDKKKQMFGILGLPHSGTTIINTIINSCDNAFCISEPHWILLSSPEKIRFDKLGRVQYSGADDIYESIMNGLQNNRRFDFGGLKETYRPQDAKIKKYIDKIGNKCDYLLCTVRNPKYLYNSHKRLAVAAKKNPMPLSRLIYDYTLFIKEIAHKKQKAIIILEKLCDSGNNNAISYLNELFQNNFKIKGHFILNPTNFIYGNYVANKSQQILPANNSIELLTIQEHKEIDNSLMDAYNYMYKGGIVN